MANFNSDDLLLVILEITNGGANKILDSLKEGSDKYKQYKRMEKEIKEIGEAGGVVEVPGEFPT